MVRVLSSVVGYHPDDHGWATRTSRRRRVAGHGRPPVRRAPLVHGLRGGGGVRQGHRLGAAPACAAAGWPSSSCATASSRRSGSASRCRPQGSARRASGRSSGSDGIVESDSYGKVRLGRGDSWEDVFEMPPFALNADIISPVRLKAFSKQVEEFAQAIRDGSRGRGLDGENGRAAVELVEATAALVRDRARPCTCRSTRGPGVRLGRVRHAPRAACRGRRGRSPPFPTVTTWPTASLLSTC